MKRYIVYVLLVLSGFCVSCDEYLKTKTYGEILPGTTEKRFWEILMMCFVGSVFPII